GAGRVRRGHPGEPRPRGLPGHVGVGRDEGPRRPASGGGEVRAHLQPGPRCAAGDACGESPAAGGPGARTHRAPPGGRGARDVTGPTGVLAMAYGTAAGPEDVERYYTDIRGGRTPPPDLLRNLQ